ncbi:uncharacterized protein RSE6_00250 [Rhynchosporium secalis]|uniref:Fungal N-terminal domain-containing protein n=1 Tax=Rhynchosporium secalis TaxID=38038 RepID=A0A1E1LUS3_RHYSE|nr:uncharacterized protein RSE6_00250 [Rhynchosporium secalis]
MNLSLSPHPFESCHYAHVALINGSHGGVASFVGILGFTGQAVSGLLKLEALLSDAAAAKETINHVIETIDLLNSTLKEVERVVRIIETSPQHQIDSQAILQTDALKYQTKACARDVVEWISAAKKLDPRSRKGIKAFLRKIKVAAGKESLQALGEGISSDQQRIGIGLSLLGSSLDILGIHHLDNIDKGLSGLTEAHLKLNDLIDVNQQKNNTANLNEESIVALLISQLDQIGSGSASESSLQSIHESISSLASSFSQLVAKLPTGQQNNNLLKCEASPIPQTFDTPQWGCDAVSGIEEAFEGDMCIYCCKRFPEQGLDANWKARGQHIAREHYFGACNLGMTFSSWMSMKQHLSEFHDLSAEAGERDTECLFSCPSRSLPIFQRNLEDKIQVMKLFDEKTASSNILSVAFASAMNKFDIKSELQLLKTCFRGSILKNNGGVREKISSLIRQYLAYLIEELVVEERDEMPGKIPDLPSDSAVFNYTSVLGSMLLILTEEIEAKRWKDKIEPLFASSTASYVAESLARNDRINPWLFNVLRHSNNTRHLVSDGAVDSRDNLLESPVSSQNVLEEQIEERSPRLGGSRRRQSTSFMRGGSSNGSAASLTSELASKRSPWKKQQILSFGGSSNGSIPSLPEQSKMVRSKEVEKVLDDEVFQTDDEYIGESVFDDVEDSSEWDD